jgi:hypothetical protein
MLKLADLRKTTRRAGEGDLRVVYPRFLRDRALAPRLEMAVRYLEGMLGHPRRELQAEVIVQLFGDHKLAKCILVCLAETYRHRPRLFAELLPAVRVAALAERGITDASTLRLWLFRRANGELPGFVGGEERAPFLRATGEELGLAPDLFDTLFALDAPANAVLVRTGPVPTPDDVIARYNREIAAALLANASTVRIKLAAAPANPAALRALCATADVSASLGGHELMLQGRQDALAGWARHGARLAALVSDLLASGLPARTGEALIAAPTGGAWRFRLDAEVFGYLGAPQGAAPMEADALALARNRAPNLLADFAAGRRNGGTNGWSLRRATAPLVVADGVVPVLATAVRGSERVALVPAPTLPEAHTQLKALADRVPLVLIEMVEAAAEDARRDAYEDGAIAKSAFQSTTANALLPSLRFARRQDVSELPTLLADAVRRAARQSARTQLDALMEETRAAGVVIEARLIERLGCDEDELPARLMEPATSRILRARGVRYVEGFGLCSAEVLTRAEAASADVAHLRGNPAVGSAWVLRVLGRKLREVTGASEGIECLIAYLGAA